MEYDIFLICPVRNATEEQKTAMINYINKLEKDGFRVYYPARDTNQIDNIGFRICKDNKQALSNSKEIHIFYDKTSNGSLFDLGMAFAFNKPLYIVNINDIEQTQIKSFANMILEWSKNNV